MTTHFVGVPSPWRGFAVLTDVLFFHAARVSEIAGQEPLPLSGSYDSYF